MIDDLLLVAPLLIPLATSVACFLLRKNPAGVLKVALTGSTLCLLTNIVLARLVIAEGIQKVSLGGWKAPFGIVFIADHLSIAMLLASSVLNIAITTYACSDLRSKSSFILYHVLIQVLIAAVHGALLTGDIFNLYVWFEVMLITSFALMTLDAQPEQIKATLQYVVLNMVATMVLLLTIGLIYACTGTLNMAELHFAIPELSQYKVMTISGMLLFSLCIKTAVFPFQLWLPASYHTLPTAVVALFAGLLTKVGAYAIIRFFTLIVPLSKTGWQAPLLGLATLTMVIGVWSAASRTKIKEILSIHIISQIGYIVMGVALQSKLAIAGSIYYLLHNMVVKTNLFLIGGILSHKRSSDSLATLGGAYKARPFLSLIFFLSAFSLAGFPPFSGFWGKLILIKASIIEGYFFAAALALGVGLFTSFSMSKIWRSCFWKPHPDGCSPVILSPTESCLMFIPALYLCVLSLLMGIFAEPLFLLFYTAADHLINPIHYIEVALDSEGTK